MAAERTARGFILIESGGEVKGESYKNKITEAGGDLSSQSAVRLTAPIAARGAKGRETRQAHCNRWEPRERLTGVLDDHKGGGAVTLIADDPIVRCMERTGYPPWMIYGGKNDEEEQETEHE